MQTKITPEASKIIKEMADAFYATEKSEGTYSKMDSNFIQGMMQALTSPELLQEMRLSKDEWVSVKESMPELNTEVIIYGNGIGTAVYEYSEKDGYNCFVNESYDMFISDNITHWKPLPQPPINK